MIFSITLYMYSHVPKGLSTNWFLSFTIFVAAGKYVMSKYNFNVSKSDILFSHEHPNGCFKFGKSVVDGFGRET